MADERRFIKITEEGFFLTSDLFVPYLRTNLTDYPDFFAKDSSLFGNTEIYCEVEVLSFTKQSKMLHLEILEFFIEKKFEFEEQKKKGDVKCIHFEALAWDTIFNLRHHLVTHKLIKPTAKKDAYVASIINAEIEEQETQEKHTPAPIHIKKEEDNAANKKKTKAPVITNYNFPELKFIDEKIDFDSVQLRNGEASFKYVITDLWKSFTIVIPNPHLVEEFNCIKPYFQQVLDCNWMSIKGHITLQDKEIINYSLKSKDLERINSNLIEKVKLKRFSELKNMDYGEVGIAKMITAEDIFTMLGDLDGGDKVFLEDDFDMLQALMKLKKVRNEEHLLYLAHHQNNEIKLRFTLNPDFGFVFLISSETKNHFCWELLDSNATYVWSVDKDMEINEQLDIVDTEISRIYKVRRQKYKAHYKMLVENNDFTYTALNHSKIEIDPNAFESWKRRFEDVTA